MHTEGLLCSACTSQQALDEQEGGPEKGESEEQSLHWQSAAEMETARRAGFIPICAMVEAAALSNRHQPPLAADGGDSIAMASRTWQGQGMHAFKGASGYFGEFWYGKCVRRSVWVALEWAPRMVAKLVFWATPAEILLGIAEGVPGADYAILLFKRLSEDRGWIAGRTYARWQLDKSSAGALTC